MTKELPEDPYNIALFCQVMDLPLPEREYIFAKPRKFPFDYAWPAEKVAMEIDGGVWRQGRHVRPKGFIKDCEKLNIAVMNGWAVLRFTPDQYTKDPARIGMMIKELLHVRRVGDHRARPEPVLAEAIRDA